LNRVRFEFHLPRRQAFLEDLLLGRAFLRRLVVPPVFVCEPVLDRTQAALDAGFPKIRLDHGAGALGLGLRACVDEKCVVVARDDQALALELLRQLARFGAEIDPEPLEQALRVLFLEVDPDPPIVVHEAILSEIARCSRCLVIPPSQKGKPAPRIRAVSTSAAAGTTPSSSRCRISSAIAASAVSRISSWESGACSAAAISSRPSA